jgi:hypothetical protein
MPDQVLRLNQLRRRAADLGTDVFHVVRLDATEQPEPPPEADDGARENVPRSPDDGAY